MSAELAKGARWPTDGALHEFVPFEEPTTVLEAGAGMAARSRISINIIQGVDHVLR
jgi:hypothetical protein